MARQAKAATERRGGRQPGPLVAYFRAALGEFPGLSAEEALRGAARAGLDVGGRKADAARQAFRRAQKAVLAGGVAAPAAPAPDAAPPQAAGAAEALAEGLARSSRFLAEVAAMDDLGLLLVARAAADGLGGVGAMMSGLRAVAGVGGPASMRTLLDLAEAGGAARLLRCLETLASLGTGRPPAPPGDAQASP